MCGEGLGNGGDISRTLRTKREFPTGTNLRLRGGVLRPEDFQLRLDGLQQDMERHIEESNQADLQAGRKPRLVPFEEFCLEKKIDLKEIDMLVEEASRNYDPTDEYNISKQFPMNVVPDEFEELAEVKEVHKAWMEGTLTEEDEMRLIGEGKEGMIPSFFNLVNVPKDQLIEELLGMFASHNNYCKSENCSMSKGIPEESLRTMFLSMDYWSVQRAHEELSSAFDERYDVNPYSFKIIGDQRVSDCQLVNYARSKGYLVLPCQLDPDIPFCNLCHDNEIAEVQISEGKRNRDISLNCSFLVIPDHYDDFLQLMEKSFSRTFWDDELNRGWKRRQVFGEPEKQYSLSREFKKNPWWCNVLVRKGTWEWDKPSKNLWTSGVVLMAKVKSGRGNQSFQGDVDRKILQKQRKKYNGALQPSERLFPERQGIGLDVPVLRGSWRLDAFTNGSFSGLIMSSNKDQEILKNQTDPDDKLVSQPYTFLCCDGPWIFESCDIRSVKGVAFFATSPGIPLFDAKTCQRCKEYYGLQDLPLDEDYSEFLPPIDLREANEDMDEQEDDDQMQLDYNALPLEHKMSSDVVEWKPQQAHTSELAVQQRKKPLDSWPPCCYREPPRISNVSFDLCAIGGEGDSLMTRSLVGLHADRLSIVRMQDSCVEDTYTGVAFYDSSRSDMHQCLLQRNGVAVTVADCSVVRVMKCKFVDQRQAVLCTIAPPEMVSKYAVDGGPSGYGTLSRPEYGVGNLTGAKPESVRWDETDMSLRLPSMTLIGNKADECARLWWTSERPAHLRGNHDIEDVKCDCARVICDLDCEPECSDRNHPGRRLDNLRKGNCSLLQADNDFETEDTNFDPTPREIRIDDTIKFLLQHEDKQLMPWQREAIEEYKRKLCGYRERMRQKEMERKEMLESKMEIEPPLLMCNR